MSLPSAAATDRRDGSTRARPSWGATVGAACLPAVAGYFAAVALLALLAAAAGGAGSSLAGAVQAGAVGWLVGHHVPLTVDGAPLGVLPLLPTLLIGVLVARGAARLGSRSGIHTPADAGWVALTIAGTHGVLGAVLALVATPTRITADPGQAAVGCALVAGVAAGLGLARRCGVLPAALRRAPDWVRPGLVAGAWGLGVLLTAGLATVLTALVVSAPEVGQLSGSDAGSALGLTVLSIGYLPNAAIAGLSWLAGSGFSVGALSVSPVAIEAGPVPAVPLLAALPLGPVQPWWGAALAVPVLIGAAVGRRCVAAAPDLVVRLRVLGVGATVLALGSAVLAVLAGGRLGAGVFDPIDVPAGPLAVAVLGATLLGGCAATLLAAQVAPSRVDGAADPLSAEAGSGSGSTAATGTAGAADDEANGGSALHQAPIGAVAHCGVDAGGDEQDEPDDRQPQQCLKDHADDDECEPDGEQCNDETHDGVPFRQQ